MIPLDVNLEQAMGTDFVNGVGYHRAVGVAKLTVKAYDRSTDQVVSYTGDFTGLEIRTDTPEPKERDLGIRLDVAATGNRWAAFTEEELSLLIEALDFDDEDRQRDLRHELKAELSARAALRSKPA